MVCKSTTFSLHQSSLLILPSLWAIPKTLQHLTGIFNREKNTQLERKCWYSWGLAGRWAPVLTSPLYSLELLVILLEHPAQTLVSLSSLCNSQPQSNGSADVVMMWTALLMSSEISPCTPCDLIKHTLTQDFQKLQSRTLVLFTWTNHMCTIKFSRW